MLLGRVLKETAQRTPDRPALFFGPRYWTYAQIDDATARMAASLAASGVQPGDRVALFLPKCPSCFSPPSPASNSAPSPSR
jgi:acyl-CoA synthetase (AMP-forming)/AMP-acid ligase II